MNGQSSSFTSSFNPKYQIYLSNSAKFRIIVYIYLYLMSIVYIWIVTVKYIFSVIHCI